MAALAVLSTILRNYYNARCFSSALQLNALIGRAFNRRKTLYFDEVENAGVWSFYLIDRDLHHTFEEYVLDRGLPAYAVWSRSGDGAQNLPRCTFPIAETTHLYRKPVPRAGDSLRYVIEVLDVKENSAVFGFLAYCTRRPGTESLEPSATAVWDRVFVKFRDDQRDVAPLPPCLRSVLEEDLTSGFSAKTITKKH